MDLREESKTCVPSSFTTRHNSGDLITFAIQFAAFPFVAIQQSVMIAQWDSSLSVLPMARVRFPATVEYFKGFFPG